MLSHPVEQRPVSRRQLLQASLLTAGGAALADVLRLRSLAASQSAPRRETSVIFVVLGGGPSQYETYTPKPEAPVEYRGAFGSISTRVPGVSFCELLPQQAQLMDKVSIVRSVHHEQASHIALHIVYTGYDLRSSANALKGEMPTVGSVASRVRGVGPTGIPAFVALPRLFAYASPHWLGAQHQYFGVREDPNEPDFQVSNLAPNEKVTVDQLQDRRALRRRLDRQTRMVDLERSADTIDAFSQQAFDLVTGEAARKAFDIERETPALRDRYGRTSIGQRMLLARRLVEAGVPFVTVRMGDWDDHIDLPGRIRKRAPEYDAGLSALINDLHERDMQRDVLVVAMGEFGRTPRVNPNGGRDHYPAVNNVLLSGGDFRMGQVIGETDRNGAEVVEAPYRPQSVLAMVYRHLGIDPGMTFKDYAGRPRYVLEQREPITELI
ncbi:MAG: DUF1501 domain-containing protein [Pirellulaceae bacterium]